MLPARCYICIFYSNSVWRNVISNNCCVVAWLKTRQLSVMTGLIRFRFLFSTCLLFIYVNSCASSAAASSSSIRFSSCVLEAVSSQRLSGASWKPNSLQNVTQRYFFSFWLTSLGTGTRTHAIYRIEETVSDLNFFLDCCSDFWIEFYAGIAHILLCFFNVNFCSVCFLFSSCLREKQDERTERGHNPTQLSSS